MNIRKGFIIGCALSALLAAADAPEGYYDACTGKNKSALKSQLYSIVKNHTAISYSDGTWKAFQYTDVDPTGSYWMDIYTHEQVSISGHSGMNVEHTFPKSWWGGINNDAWKDIVHLMPVDQWANNDRSNYPFAEVKPGTEKAPNHRCPSPNYKVGKPMDGQAGNTNWVFEPADEYKGDMARTYFYMVTCYQDLTWDATGSLTAAQGIYPTLQPWAIEMLLRWHRNDPVSEKERKRNDGVYSQQRNRNPFIDHPEMVEHIWGNMQDIPWNAGETPIDPPIETETPEITAPLDGDITIFEAAGPLEETIHVIPVLGQGFTHSVSAKISGPDASMFSFMLGSTPLQSVTLAAADINDPEGTTLTVRYIPTESTGELNHQATLTLSGRDLEKDVTMSFEGICAAASITLPTPAPGADARYFTLDGRMLDNIPSAPGLYIVVSGGKAYKYLAR